MTETKSATKQKINISIFNTAVQKLVRAAGDNLAEGIVRGIMFDQTSNRLGFFLADGYIIMIEKPCDKVVERLEIVVKHGKKVVTSGPIWDVVSNTYMDESSNMVSFLLDIDAALPGTQNRLLRSIVKLMSKKSDASAETKSIAPVVTTPESSAPPPAYETDT